MTDYRSVEHIPASRDAFLSHYHNDVYDIAAKLDKEHASIEADDIAQAIFENVLLNYQTGFADLSRGAALWRLWRAGRAFVRRETIDYMYFSGAFTYTPKLVRTLLELHYYETQPVGVGSDAQASNVDIMRALSAIGDDRREAILRRYQAGVRTSDMTTGEKSALYRGIDDMTDYLNRTTPIMMIGLGSDDE